MASVAAASRTTKALICGSKRSIRSSESLATSTGDRLRAAKSGTSSAAESEAIVVMGLSCLRLAGLCCGHGAPGQASREPPRAPDAPQSVP
ncbi:hypothetical protein [Bosea sp. RAC05]|uniref:hypothetical protein n=1 Tax=Bosea sp. RAC05 TaxID=1842539 RepID=UPI001F25850B|nr:hypothetical protein [Bosea sp. RAC05]